MNKEKDTGLLQEKDDQVDEIVDHVKRLPEQQQQQTIAKLEMHSGPIPTPSILKEYDNLDPGAAKLIIENGVEESKHRRDMESKSLEYTRRDRKRRDWMGFSFGLVGIVFGGLLIQRGHTIPGTVFSGVSLAMLVGLFLGNPDEVINNSDDEDDN